MFRGRSTSADNPALTLGLSYDHDSGLYAGGSITAVAGRNVGPRFGAATQYLGYATSLDRLSADIGIVHRSYSRLYTVEYADDYFEGYVGLSGRDVGGRLYFCPDFDGQGAPAAYAEINATFLSREKWTLSGHAGALLPPRDHDTGVRKVTLDGRLGLARRVGRISMGFDLVGIAHQESRKDSAHMVLSVSSAF